MTGKVILPRNFNYETIIPTKKDILKKRQS